MLRVFSLIVVLLLIVCCTCDDTVSRGNAHQYSETQRVLLHNDGGYNVAFDVPYLQGGVAPFNSRIFSRASFDNHLLMQYMGDAHLGNSLFCDVELLSGDSIVLYIRFSYLQEADSLIEVVNGTLHLPIECDSADFYHKFLIPGSNFYEFQPLDTPSQQILLGVDYLLM